MQTKIEAKPLWNPYVAGVALGLVLLASYLILGHGIGASGAASRLGVTAMNAVAPEHVQASGYFKKYVSEGHSPLNDWLVFEVLGMFLGGLLSAMLGGRQKSEITRGPNISSLSRMGLALTGGVIMGVAARIARGCTSGQALSGGALLSAGSWLFMLSVFAGGYALAMIVKKEWI